MPPPIGITQQGDILSTRSQPRAGGAAFDEKQVYVSGPTINLGGIMEPFVGPEANGGFGGRSNLAAGGSFFRASDVGTPLWSNPKNGASSTIPLLIILGVGGIAAFLLLRK